MVFCKLRALDKIQRLRVLRRPEAMRKMLNAENSELVCKELRAETIPKNVLQ